MPIGSGVNRDLRSMVRLFNQPGSLTVCETNQASELVRFRSLLAVAFEAFSLETSGQLPDQCANAVIHVAPAHDPPALIGGQVGDLLVGGIRRPFSAFPDQEGNCVLVNHAQDVNNRVANERGRSRLS